MIGIWEKLFLEIKKKGLLVNKGLSEKEIVEIEQFYQIKFAPDHKLFLKHGLVIGDRFYNWRDDSKNNVKKIKEMLDWPLEGIIFDYENNNFTYSYEDGNGFHFLSSVHEFKVWYEANVPKLIPIYGHRFMSPVPENIGSPVYSIYQTDIIYYGANIFTFFDNEFQFDLNINYPKWETDQTPFWSELVR